MAGEIRECHCHCDSFLLYTNICTNHDGHPRPESKRLFGVYPRFQTGPLKDLFMHPGCPSSPLQSFATKTSEWPRHSRDDLLASLPAGSLERFLPPRAIQRRATTAMEQRFRYYDDEVENKLDQPITDIISIYLLRTYTIVFIDIFCNTLYIHYIYCD